MEGSPIQFDIRTPDDSLVVSNVRQCGKANGG